MVRTSAYVFIVGSVGFTMTLKLGHAVKKPYWVLEQDQHTVVIQRKELVKWDTADRVALASLPTEVLPIPPEKASAVKI